MEVTSNKNIFIVYTNNYEKQRAYNYFDMLCQYYMESEYAYTIKKYRGHFYVQAEGCGMNICVSSENGIRGQIGTVIVPFEKNYELSNVINPLHLSIVGYY